MTQHAIPEVIAICGDIKRDARRIYVNLADNSGSEELSRFWVNMAVEEGREIGHWESMHKQAGEQLIPNLFDSPERTLEELEAIKVGLSELEALSDSGLGVKDSFILACQLELYLLNPAFEVLLQFSRSLSNETPHSADYESHLSRFIEAFKRYDVDNPELKLLGGTIQRLWKQNRQLAILSNTDGLTGVHNRRGLFLSLRTMGHLAQRNKSKIGLMMIDLDHFKQVNDRFGHQRGDDILRRVASIIKERIRISDLMGRYGGEEFLVFLSPVELDGLLVLAEQIRQRVADSIVDGLGATISIGLVHGHLNGGEVGGELDRLIQIADQRLYRAKAAGRNCVVGSD
jgi:diguanylate cyclase (GGDEF)-like protein